VARGAPSDVVCSLVLSGSGEEFAVVAEIAQYPCRSAGTLVAFGCGSVQLVG
jgi:hypothetical protein